MNDLIYHCNMQINKEKLLDEYHELSNKLSTFSELNPEWLKAHEAGTYGNQLKEMFEKEGTFSKLKLKELKFIYPLMQKLQMHFLMRLT